MLKQVVNFEEKHHVLEVDGIEYEIPQRTVEIEKKISEHDKNITAYTEYENNMNMLEILFGTEAAKTMFPDVKTTNLDKLSECTRMALAAYYATANSVENDAINKATEELKLLLKDLVKVSKNMGNADNEHINR